jgi:integrase
MRGHVHRRGSGWGYVADVGTDPVTGGRRQRTKSGFKTKRKAEEAVRAVLAEVRTGAYVPSSTETVGEYLAAWLERAEPNLRRTTWDGQRKSVGYLTSQPGSVPLQHLQPIQLEACYAELAKSGGIRGKGLSPKTIGNAHAVMRRALGDAERLGLIPRNAARLARPPKVENVEMPTWTSDELGVFLESVREDRLYAAFVVLATTGMRRGDLLGLRWADLDLNAGHLSVKQTITASNYQIIVGPTKTARSRRRIELDPVTVECLRQHRRDQAAERLTRGAEWQDHDLVSCDTAGEPLHPDRFTRYFCRQVSKADVTQIRGPHDLRHTWATLGLKAGVHPKVVSDRLGHSTISITLDIYSHVTPSLDANAANVVAGAIFGSERQRSQTTVRP